MDKISSEEFNRLWKSSGSQTKKGRPVISMEDQKRDDKPNRKVINAVKIRDEGGNVLADSKWEYNVLVMLTKAKLKFEKQRKFELLPTVKIQGERTLQKRFWMPDFTFEDAKVVVDAKGYTTEMSKIKMHLFRVRYPEYELIIVKKISDVYNTIEYINNKLVLF